MSRIVRAGGCLALLILLSVSQNVSAGMPSALPSDWPMVQRLTYSAEARIQGISFFLAGLLLSAFVIQRLWNYLRRDFTRLPRLSYLKSLSAVLLWGLSFVIVLTMISGARELMTPGAWEKDGHLYRLESEDKHE